MAAEFAVESLGNRQLNALDPSQEHDRHWLNFYNNSEKDALVRWNRELRPRLCPASPPLLPGLRASCSGSEHDLSSVLEIATGGGRWTAFLANISAHVVGVDLNRVGIETVAAPRFKGFPHVEVHCNDATPNLLPMVANRSITFAFTYDSMVHFPPDAVGSYLAEVSRVLSPGGTGFFHHSDLVECSTIGLRPGYFGHGHFARAMDASLDAKRLGQCGVPVKSFKNPLGRNLMTCAEFARRAKSHGLEVTQQERIPWGTWYSSPANATDPRSPLRNRSHFIFDCLTTLRLPR